MSIVIVTGSAGLIGAETAGFFAGKGSDMVGIDNDMRCIRDCHPEWRHPHGIGARSGKVHDRLAVAAP